MSNRIQLDLVELLPTHEELANFAIIVKDWSNAVEVLVSEEDEERLKEFDESCEILGLDKGVILQALTILDVLYKSQPEDEASEVIDNG